MANFIQVIPEEMAAAARNLNEKINDWQTGVQDLYRLAEELDDMWDGLANSQFNLNFNEDLPKYNRLAELMTEYAQAIQTAASKYMEGEQEVADIIKRV